jgi:ferredoxin
MTGKSLQSVSIFYFSGTGTTRKAALCIEDCLRNKGLKVRTSPVSLGKYPAPGDDMVVLLFAVHAMHAPEAVYRWINRLPQAQGVPAAVISVSGGGEIFPNTASRASAIRKLQKKGYKVFYEDMLVMPSNCLERTDDALAAKLIEVLPKKAEAVARNLFSREVRRTKPFFADRVISFACEAEKAGARLFGRFIRCNDNCNGCGWCSRNCPASNITMRDSRPEIGKRCNMCLGCLYGCPRKALSQRLFGFFLFREGFSLSEIESKIPWPFPVDVGALAKGYFWSGLRRYLEED